MRNVGVWVRALYVLALCGFDAQAALAQDEVVKDTAAEETVDEITVYGEKSLPKLKLEYEAAELNFYNLYNDINDDRRFDVICREEAPTGSHIKQRVCWPRYELEAREQEGKSNFFRGYTDPGMAAEELFIKKKMREQIAKLAEEDPRLLKALIEYRDKYQIYKNERVRRCVGGPVLCGGGDSED
jgi:hypothetical protein